MHNLDFEARKSAVIVISSLLGRKVGNRCPVSDYICAGHREDFLFTLLAGYDIPEIALNCGMLLRECIRHESLAQILLESKQVLCLFSLVNVPNFDVASDAFATLRDLFTRHPLLTATYLIERYDELVFSLHALLTSDNYMTKRQSLKLVGEILLERNSCDVMNRYVSSPEHLKTIMRLLRDPSSSVQFEAFHVFKVSFFIPEFILLRT